MTMPAWASCAGVQSRPKPRGRSTSRASSSTSQTSSRNSAVRDSARGSRTWSRQSWYSACRVRSSARAAAHRAGRDFGRTGRCCWTGTSAARRSRKRRCRSPAAAAQLPHHPDLLARRYCLHQEHQGVAKRLAAGSGPRILALPHDDEIPGGGFMVAGVAGGVGRRSRSPLFGRSHRTAGGCVRRSRSGHATRTAPVSHRPSETAELPGTWGCP